MSLIIKRNIFNSSNYYLQSKMKQENCLSFLHVRLLNLLIKHQKVVAMT